MEVDIEDLLFRYDYLVGKYTAISIELAEKLEKFSKYRKELVVLTEKFKEIGIEAKDYPELVKKIEESLKKFKKEQDETTD